MRPCSRRLTGLRRAALQTLSPAVEPGTQAGVRGFRSKVRPPVIGRCGMVSSPSLAGSLIDCSLALLKARGRRFDYHQTNDVACSHAALGKLARRRLSGLLNERVTGDQSKFECNTKLYLARDQPKEGWIAAQLRCSHCCYMIRNSPDDGNGGRGRGRTRRPLQRSLCS